MKAEPMRTLTISLTSHQASRIQRSVAAGDYASNSEIIREALRLWERREELRALELERFKHAYDEGMASGPGRTVDAAELLRDLKQERAKRG